MNFFIYIKKDNAISPRIRKICKDRKMVEIHGQNSVFYHKNNAYPADCVSLFFDEIFSRFMTYVGGMEERTKNIFYNNAVSLEQRSYFVYVDETTSEEELLDLLKKNIKKEKK